MTLSNYKIHALLGRIMIIVLFASATTSCSSMRSVDGELTAQRILEEINVGDLVQVVTLDGGKYQLKVSEITKLRICDAERCIPLDTIASIESKKISLVKTIPTVLAAGYLFVALLFAIALGSI